MARGPYYPGINLDDMWRLDALAASARHLGTTFDEAYALLEGDSPREVAERCWNDCVAFYGPIVGDAT